MWEFFSSSVSFSVQSTTIVSSKTTIRSINTIYEPVRTACSVLQDGVEHVLKVPLLSIYFQSFRLHVYIWVDSLCRLLSCPCPCPNCGLLNPLTAGRLEFSMASWMAWRKSNPKFVKIRHRKKSNSMVLPSSLRQT